MSNELTEAGGKTRLYVAGDLGEGVAVTLDEGQTHYLLHVLRAETGNLVSLFNGRDGEWLAEITAAIMARFAVKADRPRQPASELSGGNQQKLVLGKWLQLGPRLVLLDEPTQGIDVGARREIYDRLVELCQSGTSVICATSEFEQLETIAHRVLVFDRGRIKAELAGDQVTKSAIAHACYQENRTHAPA